MPHHCIPLCSSCSTSNDGQHQQQQQSNNKNITMATSLCRYRTGSGSKHAYKCQTPTGTLYATLPHVYPTIPWHRASLFLPESVANFDHTITAYTSEITHTHLSDMHWHERAIKHFARASTACTINGSFIDAKKSIGHNVQRRLCKQRVRHSDITGNRTYCISK